jgi:methanesulfonate monooxygenase small subunit
MTISDEAVKDLIYRSCLLLDGEDFDGYLAICASEFKYKITAFSPEIRRPMTWMEQTREEMVDLFAMLPKHVRMPGEFTRHATVYTLNRDQSNGHATVITSFIVLYTDPEGVSRIFATGQYHDTVDIRGAAPVLAAREVRLKTRDLSPGSHIPI